MEVKRVLGIHGRATILSGSATSFHDRRKDLENRWIVIDTPQFNPSEDPSYESWEQELQKIDFSQYNVILASSHGCGVITKYLLDTHINIPRIVMIAPWRWITQRMNTSLLYNELEGQDSSLQQLVDECIVISSKDDDVVLHEISKAFAEKIRAKFIAVNGYGHRMVGEMIIAVNDLLQFGDSNLLSNS